MATPTDPTNIKHEGVSLLDYLINFWPFRQEDIPSYLRDGSTGGRVVRNQVANYTIQAQAAEEFRPGDAVEIIETSIKHAQRSFGGRDADMVIIDDILFEERNHLRPINSVSLPYWD